ncbi:MAG TPA: HAD-IIB family hydrolase [Longimicrobiales bacterium]|nr:HAD-IIB family hydrolase [Longimicrobiales bacterium]
MPPSHSWLLASDMDGTVIPLDDEPSRRAEIADLAEALRRAPELTLAYVTGRSLGLALRGIEAFGLPIPAFVAADVGTRIHRRTGQDFVPDPDYDAAMARAMGGVELSEVGRVVEELPGFRLQPETQQGRFKRSYYVPGDVPEAEIVGPAGERLRREGARVMLVHSHDPLTGEGLLDLLPADVAKDTAVRHLARVAGVPGEGVVYAGDSGNDMAAFLGGFAGILVGNAPGALRDRLREARDESGGGMRIHFARAPFAAGVLEGLHHFGAVPGG